jgi:predicted MPP superfamily phosphohydrolase
MHFTAPEVPCARRPHGRWAVLAIFLALLALALRAFWLEPASLRVSHYTPALRHCPPALAGLRIAVLSDIHAGAPFIDLEKIHRIAAMNNAEHPDLVFIAGDIFVQHVKGGHNLPADEIAAALGELRAKFGVYAVLGNHDYTLPPPDHYWRQLRDNGIVPLDNAAVPIDRDGRRFWLAGFEDLTNGHPDIVGTLAKIPDDVPIIALTHEPDLFPEIPARVNLLVAGHTHGGQVRLPLLGVPIVPSAFGYVGGHYVAQTDMFISTGIGTSHIPVRFGVPPEISLLTLEPEQNPRVSEH